MPNYQGPNIVSPCVDDPGGSGQVLVSQTVFDGLSIDSTTGDVYVLEVGYRTQEDGHPALQSHGIVEYGAAGQSRYVSVEQLLGSGPNGTFNQEPVHFTAANGALIVAGIHYLYDGTAVARLTVSNGSSPATYSWDLAQAPTPGYPAPPLNQVPDGDLPFTVNCVAANQKGDIYAGGASLGTFDGADLPDPQIWVAGWLTYFNVPTP